MAYGGIITVATTLTRRRQRRRQRRRRRQPLRRLDEWDTECGLAHDCSAMGRIHLLRRRVRTVPRSSAGHSARGRVLYRHTPCCAVRCCATDSPPTAHSFVEQPRETVSRLPTSDLRRPASAFYISQTQGEKTGRRKHDGQHAYEPRARKGLGLVLMPCCYVCMDLLIVCVQSCLE
jgi:hypothetical protein